MLAEDPGNHGRNFIFAVPPNSYGENEEVGVVIQAATDQVTTVNIKAPLQSWNISITLPNMSAPYKYQLPQSLHGTRVFGVKDTTVQVSSDHDIVLVVYTTLTDTGSTDTFTAIPYQQMGREYFVTSYDGYRDYEGFILISAPNEPCSVNIACSAAVEYSGGRCSNGEILEVELHSYHWRTGGGAWGGACPPNG